MDNKYCIYLTEDEVLNFTSALGFVLNYCDVPRIVAAKLVSLQVYLENLTCDKR